MYCVVTFIFTDNQYYIAYLYLCVWLKNTERSLFDLKKGITNTSGIVNFIDIIGFIFKQFNMRMPTH